MQKIVLFHPDNDGHLFIVYTVFEKEDGDDENTLRLVVQEIEGGISTIHHTNGVYRTCCNSHIRFRKFPHDDVRMVDGEYISWRFRQHVHDLRFPALYSCPHEYSKDRRQEEGNHVDTWPVFTVKFDIYRKKFIGWCFHMPDRHSDENDGGGDGLDLLGDNSFHNGWFSDFLVLRDQALFPVYQVSTKGEFRPPRASELVLVALKPCHEISATRGKIPWYGKGTGRLSRDAGFWLCPEDDIFHNNGVSFCWIDISEELKLTWPRHQMFERRVVDGDKDFVVLFTDTHIAVWCFDKDVKLSPSLMYGVRHDDDDPDMLEHHGIGRF